MNYLMFNMTRKSSTEGAERGPIDDIGGDFIIKGANVDYQLVANLTLHRVFPTFQTYKIRSVKPVLLLNQKMHNPYLFPPYFFFQKIAKYFPSKKKYTFQFHITGYTRKDGT